MRDLIENQFNFETTAWKEISPNAIELTKKLLEIDSEKRIKAVKALNDRWLLNIIKAQKNNQRKILNSSVI